MKNTPRSASILKVIFLAFPLWLTVGVGQDASKEPGPRRELSWPVPDLKKIRMSLETFLSRADVPREALQSLGQLDLVQGDSHERLNDLLMEVAIFRDWVKTLVERPEEQTIVEMKTGVKSDSVRNQVLLAAAILLVDRKLIDESLQILDHVEGRWLVDPARKFVFRAICLHQLGESEAALQQLELLIANRGMLSVRYQSLVDSMYADLKKAGERPLHRISRLMGDVSRRQGLERFTPRVLAKEERIVQQLDEVIRQLEQQQEKRRMAQKQKSAQQNRQDGGNSSPPELGGPQGVGSVTSREQDDDGAWGKLDNREKAIAVRNLVRDLPPHFQSLMKAYFQKLAEERK